MINSVLTCTVGYNYFLLFNYSSICVKLFFFSSCYSLFSLRVESIMSHAIFLYFYIFPTSFLAHIFQGLILIYPSIVCLEQPLGFLPLMLRIIIRFLISLSAYTYMTCPFLFASDKCFCVGLSIESYYLLYFYYYRYWFIFCIRQIVLFII